jgi:hypothetical protein
MAVLGRLANGDCKQQIHLQRHSRQVPETEEKGMIASLLGSRRRLAVVAIALTTCAVVWLVPASPADAWYAGERSYCKDYKCVTPIAVDIDGTPSLFRQCRAVVGLYAQYHPVHGSVKAMSIDGLELIRQGRVVASTGYQHFGWWSQTVYTSSYNGGDGPYTAHVTRFRVRYWDGYLSTNDPDKANFISFAVNTTC